MSSAWAVLSNLQRCVTTCACRARQQPFQSLRRPYQPSRLLRPSTRPPTVCLHPLQPCHPLPHSLFPHGGAYVLVDTAVQSYMHACPVSCCPHAVMPLCAVLHSSVPVRKHTAPPQQWAHLNSSRHACAASSSQGRLAGWAQAPPLRNTISRTAHQPQMSIVLSILATCNFHGPKGVEATRRNCSVLTQHMTQLMSPSLLIPQPAGSFARMLLQRHNLTVLYTHHACMRSDMSAGYRRGICAVCRATSGLGPACWPNAHGSPASRCRGLWATPGAPRHATGRACGWHALGRPSGHGRPPIYRPRTRHAAPPCGPHGPACRCPHSRRHTGERAVQPPVFPSWPHPQARACPSEVRHPNTSAPPVHGSLCKLQLCMACSHSLLRVIAGCPLP